jgi:hypothetical protein
MQGGCCGGGHGEVLLWARGGVVTMVKGRWVGFRASGCWRVTRIMASDAADDE